MTTKNQGRIIVEHGDGGFLVMTPDGQIYRRPTERGVLAIARRWGRDHMDDGTTVGLTEVEWRGCGPALRQS